VCGHRRLGLGVFIHSSVVDSLRCKVPKAPPKETPPPPAAAESTISACARPTRHSTYPVAYCEGGSRRIGLALSTTLFCSQNTVLQSEHRFCSQNTVFAVKTPFCSQNTVFAVRTPFLQSKHIQCMTATMVHAIHLTSGSECNPTGAGSRWLPGTETWRTAAVRRPADAAALARPRCSGTSCI
jgi:hypothetical protein